MTTVPNKVVELVETFGRNIDTYKSQYNEAQIRREFIDPFFESLGWDMTNKRGYAPAYRDVIHEDAIKIGGYTKAPDYCFRIGPVRKFFLEAKKPSVDIKHDIHPAYQLRRYAWSAKLPLSILTDFEEFAVYDCRNRPKHTERPSTGRIMYLTYKDYIDRWDEIVAVFSRDAILKGSFDKYAAGTKGKRGTSTVDKEFLAEIETWRKLLAQSIAKRNPKLSLAEINFAVQITIDRILFLRMCEDRGIESYSQLQSVINGKDLYPRLFTLFESADARYNSGLFHFQKEKGRDERPDELTPNLTVDDMPVRWIIDSLYYPKSPYEFSVLPAEILGNVYEQFLGKVIRVTSSHQAVVEEKPEVKKAGGVYYTPSYIVDYIVKNTVGKLCENKTPAQIAKLKILDPACGSGSFLLGAYTYLLDFHRDWYTQNNPEKHSKKIYQGKAGLWFLTIAEKKRILLNNIFGVDIDSQAVEVTKLSLLLKVLEGENKETIQHQLFAHERALPDLSNNIKCGNSLIGPDFFDNSDVDPSDEELVQKINPFDWQKEFPQIFSRKNPGFDAVIGNPPYGYMIPSEQQDYFSKTYKFQDYQKDLYLLFLERYQNLLKETGLLGVIVSNTWMLSVTYKNIRKFLTSHYRWLRILHLPEKVFSAVVDTHVLVFEKNKKGIASQPNALVVDRKINNEINEWHQLPYNLIPCDGEPINIVAPKEAAVLFRKIIKNSKPLRNFCDVYNGVKPFEKGKGNPPQTDETMKTKPFVKEGHRPDPEWSPLLRGSLINRYVNLWNNDYWILYGEWLAAPRNPAIFQAPLKIAIRQTGDSIIATIVESGFIARNNLHIILCKNNNYKYEYILGILNSSLMDLSYSIMNPEKGEALAEVKKRHVEILPIKEVNFENRSDVAVYEQIVNFVDKMLDLHKKLSAAKVPAEKTKIQRQIDATDNQIDRLVYKLYDLTPEEIEIVENSAN